MESFSLLKYWRNNNGGDSTTVKPRATTVVTAVTPYFSDDGEDGPYFDLEFSLPDYDDSDREEEGEKQNEDESENEFSTSEDENENEEEVEGGEVKFTTLEQNAAMALSPSDELFFKGDLVSIEPSSVLLNDDCGEENSNLRDSILKSATKFRVLLLKLKKSKSGNEKTEVNNNGEGDSKFGGKTEVNNNGGGDSKIGEKQGKSSGKFFTVKLKVEEVKLPLVSLFTRDNSSKQNNSKEIKQNLEETESILDEKKLTKEVVQKYLKMVKPLYVRVSKRYVDKLKFSGGGSKGGGAVVVPSEKGNQKQGSGGNNLQAGLKAVRKHLGKSRSASAALTPAPPQGNGGSERRDDSLVQLQDGIQGAIMHCKKSFNSTRDGEASSILCRSASDPSREKSAATPSLSGGAKEIN